MAKIFVTGGAGFIGSSLCGALLEGGHEVTAFDNLLLGRREFFSPYAANPRFRFVEADLLDRERVSREMAGHGLVFHLAANSDISRGARQTDLDLQIGTLATHRVLDAMRLNGVGEIVFASSSAIYGESPRIVPTPEDCGPLFPISLYGASKLACEGLISAFCHNFDMRAWIFRYANIIGPNGTHGAAFDFVTRLKKEPSRLTVLGDGRQAKPYLHVSDCVAGMWFGYTHARGAVNCFNLAVEGATPVREIAEAVVREAGLSGTAIEYTGGERGWRGDVPRVELDGGRLAALGWRASCSSGEAVRRGVRELVRQYFKSRS